MTDRELLSLQISPTSGTPIYRQLMAQIHRLVASGRLAGSEQLPSVRALAEQLEINPMTVSKAYSALELQGILLRQRGKGMVVASDRKHELDLSHRLGQLEPAIDRLLMEARQLGISEPQVLSHLKKRLKQTQHNNKPEGSARKEVRDD